MLKYCWIWGHSEFFSFIGNPSGIQGPEIPDITGITNQWFCQCKLDSLEFYPEWAWWPLGLQAVMVVLGSKVSIKYTSFSSLSDFSRYSLFFYTVVEKIQKVLFLPFISSYCLSLMLQCHMPGYYAHHAFAVMLALLCGVHKLRFCAFWRQGRHGSHW